MYYGGGDANGYTIPHTAIGNASLVYDVPEEGKTSFKAKTRTLEWDNVKDPLLRSLDCPLCWTSTNKVPWTTCADSNAKIDE